MERGIAVACVLVLVSCSSGNDTPEPTRYILPLVQDRGGPKLSHLEIVNITFAGDPDAESLDQHAAWIVTSSWLDQVGGEYGIGHGSVRATVHRMEAAPASIEDTEVIDFLYAGLGDGSLPAPSADTLYVVHYPPGTTVTSGTDESCTSFYGYHDSARRKGVEIAYAVVASCILPPLDVHRGRQVVASHEILEAATDPFPSNHPAIQLHASRSPWLALGDEVADLCNRGGNASGLHDDGDFVAVRSWSNTAAMHGDPCVPADATKPYYNVFVEEDLSRRLAPGSSNLFTLHGYATESLPDWTIETSTGSNQEFSLSLDKSDMNVGFTRELRVDIDPVTPSGAFLVAAIFSYRTTSEYQLFPFELLVGDACSGHGSCEDCAARTGCAWCAASSTCVEETPTGTTPTCTGSLATWSGGCPGFCAAHDASCAECASQFGCGWCASGPGPHCVEASEDWDHPAHGTCDYADWSFTAAYCDP